MSRKHPVSFDELDQIKAEMFELGTEFGMQRLGEYLVKEGVIPSDRHALAYRLKASKKEELKINEL